MGKPAIAFVNSYIGHLNYLNKTRSSMELLLSKGIIVRRDIEQVYTGLYIDAITSLENFIENLFIGLLVERIEPPSSQIIPRVTFKSDAVAKDIVLGGRNYVDWFPYDRTEKRAEAFFRNGLPFKNLDNASKRQLDRIVYIRNAIAHKSSHAKKMFEQNVIGTTPLPPREKTPAGFLRSVFRIAPVQTRYEELVMGMAAIAQRLCL